MLRRRDIPGVDHARIVPSKFLHHEILKMARSPYCAALVPRHSDFDWLNRGVRPHMRGWLGRVGVLADRPA